MSNWRAMADDALQGRDTRDTRAIRSDTEAGEGAFVPNVPNVPAPLTALKSWQQALLSLDPCQPREGFGIDRWQRLYDCSVWWFENYARQAAIDGWGTSDLFGLLRQVEGAGGLIDRLGNHRGLVMTADEARWRYLGKVPQLFRRGSWPNLTAWWDADL